MAINYKWSPHSSLFFFPLSSVFSFIFSPWLISLFLHHLFSNISVQKPLHGNMKNKHLNRCRSPVIKMWLWQKGLLHKVAVQHGNNGSGQVSLCGRKRASMERQEHGWLWPRVGWATKEVWGEHVHRGVAIILSGLFEFNVIRNHQRDSNGNHIEIH